MISKDDEIVLPSITDCFTWEDENGFGHMVVMNDNRTEIEWEMYKRILYLEEKIQKAMSVLHAVS